jgi:hypothetical protein
LLVIAAGCTRDEDYVQVMRDQRTARREVAEILAAVTDEKSMVEAKAKLAEQSKKIDAIAARAKALPQPLPSSVAERMRDEAIAVQTQLERLAEEMQRIKKLPGGSEFCKQLETDAPGLLSAVQK